MLSFAPHVSSIASAFAPIWVIVFIGWAAGRLRLVDYDVRDVLTGFAFNIATPALLFGTLSKISARQVDGRALAAFALGTAFVGLLAFAGARWILRERLADQTVAALTSCYVNSGNLGIPVAAGVLGDLSALVLVTVFQLLVVTPLAMTLLGADTDEHGGRRAILLGPLKNPITIASVAGLTVAALGVHPPGAVMNPLHVLGEAAVPIALFALGMSLRRTGPGHGPAHYAKVGCAVLLKVIVQPLTAFAAGRFLFHLDQRTLSAVVLFAGLPTAQNIFVYATQYRRPTDLVRDAILISSLAAMVTLFVITTLIPPG